MTKPCPVCSNEKTIVPRPELGPHPYVQCTQCLLYFQPELRPKVYEAHHEAQGDQMTDADKRVNEKLAGLLYHNHLRQRVSVGENEKYRHLDIGSKYPYLGHCLQKVSEGKVVSSGIDGIDLAGDFGEQLGVTMYRKDFENDDLSALGKFHFVTIVHCLEHMYRPLEAIQKIRDLMYPGGLLFVRSPDHAVTGIERDFTDGHYDIHPLIWTEEALKEAIGQLGRGGLTVPFYIIETYPFPGAGQRDFLLRAI